MGTTSKKPKRPYRSPTRSAARDQTRARLIAAASELLQDDRERFSLEAVAQVASVTRLTVYNQFGGRRALLEAVFDTQALSGGLGNIAEAMAMSDPHAALSQVVATFCGFWASAHAVRGVVAESMTDPELAEAIRARNERRRKLLGVLVERMLARGDVAPPTADGLVDTLFALTGFAFHAELSASRLAPDEVCATIAALSTAAVNRCRPHEKGTN